MNCGFESNNLISLKLKVNPFETKLKVKVEKVMSQILLQKFHCSTKWLTVHSDKYNLEENEVLVTEKAETQSKHSLKEAKVETDPTEDIDSEILAASTETRSSRPEEVLGDDTVEEK